MTHMHTVEMESSRIDKKIKRIKVKVTSTFEDGSTDERNFEGLAGALFIVPTWTKIGPCGDPLCKSVHVHASAIEHVTFASSWTTIDLLSKIPSVAEEAIRGAFKLFTGEEIDGSKSDK